MTATARCRVCGRRIEIGADGIEEGARAAGDEFFHDGCVEAKPSSPGPTVPRYYIPRNW